TIPVPYSCSGQMLPMPTTSRTICIASWYCRTNARQRGSGFASANLFGPYFSARPATSAAPRPCAASTPSFAVVSAASREYQASSSVVVRSAEVTVAIRAFLLYGLLTTVAVFGWVLRQSAPASCAPSRRPVPGHARDPADHGRKAHHPERT